LGRETVLTVARAWAEGKPARGRSLWTDGARLYSYGLAIGATTPDGVKVVLDSGSRGESPTTRQHTTMAISVVKHLSPRERGRVDAVPHSRDCLSPVTRSCPHLESVERPSPRA
jgi:hypothetical protein